MGCDEPIKNRPKGPQKLGEFKWALGPIKRIIKNKKQKHDKTKIKYDKYGIKHNTKKQNLI